MLGRLVEEPMTDLQPMANPPEQNGPDDSAIADFYDHLRSRARQMLMRERKNISVGATDIANEAWIRLQGVLDLTQPDWKTDHRLASLILRRMLVEYARRKRRLRRGGNLTKAEIELDALVGRVERDLGSKADLKDMLDALEAFDPDVATFVDLHFFGGMQLDECASYLGSSPSTLSRNWKRARAWLRGKFGTG